MADRRITWKIVAIASCTVVLSLSGIVYNSINSRLDKAEANIAEKVDQSQHDKDLRDIKELFNLVLSEIRRHEDNSKRRYNNER